MVAKDVQKENGVLVLVSLKNPPASIAVLENTDRMPQVLIPNLRAPRVVEEPFWKKLEPMEATVVWNAHWVLFKM
jgi:hypothetical protein